MGLSAVGIVVGAVVGPAKQNEPVKTIRIAKADFISVPKNMVSKV
jgi:hypothetical protein